MYIQPTNNGAQADQVPVVSAYPVQHNDNDDFKKNNGVLLVTLDTTHSRHGFIRKVYALLAIQLLITFGFVTLCALVDSVKLFVQDNPGFFWGAFAFSFLMLIVICCNPLLARKHPHGIILLFLFTLAESILVGFITTFYDIDEVITATGITFGVVVALTIFACQTKYDITGWGPYLFVILVVVFLFGLVLIVVQESREVRTAFAAIVVVLFSVYLVYDTQLIIGGEHKKYEFSVDDYVFAALNLYLDIVNIFLYILIIVGGGGE